MEGTRVGTKSLAVMAVAAVSLAVAPFLSSAGTPDLAPPRRWVFIHSRLATPGGVEWVEGIMRRAAALGCNGVVLTEATLWSRGEPTRVEIERAARLRKTADGLGIEIVPTVMGPNAILTQDTNLVEAVPVRDALFTVNSGLAVVTPDSNRAVANRGFEDGHVSAPLSWSVRKEGGVTASLDDTVRHSGRRSLHIAAPAGGQGHVVIVQRAQVTPHRLYRLSALVRTHGFVQDRALQPWVVGSGGRPLNYPLCRLEPDADWRRITAIFNSLDNTRVEIRLTVHQPRGALWLDTVDLEEIGLLNVVRRPGCPLSVRGEDGTLYQEGRDYEPVADPLLGRVPVLGAYDEDHSAPDGIRLTASTRIGPHARLRVSYYSCPVVYGGRVTQCLTEPATYEIMEREVRRVNRLLSPRMFLMSHDEMRVVNQCAACRARGLTAGALLADNVRRCARIVKDVSPGASPAVWSDMFDPQHNARNSYYLVADSLEGSWLGLSKDTMIVNWNSAQMKRSLEWFSARGHRQVVAAYYDHDLKETRKWVEAARGVHGVDGVMYTTWRRSYDDLEDFARIAWR